MAFRTLEVTIGAAITQLTSSRYGIRHLIIQNPVGNDSVYVGDTTTAFMVHYAHIVVAGATVSIGPFSGSAPTNTDEYYVVGTQNQKVHCILITQ